MPDDPRIEAIARAFTGLAAYGDCLRTARNVLAAVRRLDAEAIERLVRPEDKENAARGERWEAGYLAALEDVRRALRLEG